MRVHVAADHAGYELKSMLSEYLRNVGHDVVDHGALNYEPHDDYPEFCLAAAQAVADEGDSLGVVIGGSGNGEQIVANKVPGVRAALGWSAEVAKLARQHNDANVIGIGARLHSTEQAFEIVSAFLGTKFSGDPRHAHRIEQIREFEAGAGRR